MKIKFYNAGDKISETLAYSLPDGHDVHCIARHLVEAPPAGFFQVPLDIEVGQATIRVEFYKDLMRRFGDRGMIMVDPTQDEESIAERDENAVWAPVAATDKQAVAKGKLKWLEYLEGIVTRHVEQCESIRAAGGAPLAAKGMTKRAFVLLGKQDPSDIYVRVAEAKTPGATKNEIDELKAKIEQLTAIVQGNSKGSGKQQTLPEK